MEDCFRLVEKAYQMILTDSSFEDTDNVAYNIANVFNLCLEVLRNLATHPGFLDKFLMPIDLTTVITRSSELATLPMPLDSRLKQVELLQSCITQSPENILNWKQLVVPNFLEATIPLLNQSLYRCNCTPGSHKSCTTSQAVNGIVFMWIDILNSAVTDQDIKNQVFGLNALVSLGHWCATISTDLEERGKLAYLERSRCEGSFVYWNQSNILFIYQCYCFRCCGPCLAW
jgi:hypothetical protein